MGGLITFWGILRQGPRKLVAVVDMLHMLAYAQQGGGGSDNVLGDFKAGSTELVAVVDILHMLAYAQQG